MKTFEIRKVLELSIQMRNYMKLCFSIDIFNDIKKKITQQISIILVISPPSCNNIIYKDVIKKITHTARVLCHCIIMMYVSLLNKCTNLLITSWQY